MQGRLPSEQLQGFCTGLVERWQPPGLLQRVRGERLQVWFSRFSHCLPYPVVPVGTHPVSTHTIQGLSLSEPCRGCSQFKVGFGDTDTESLCGVCCQWHLDLLAEQDGKHQVDSDSGRHGRSQTQGPAAPLKWPVQCQNSSEDVCLS